MQTKKPRVKFDPNKKEWSVLKYCNDWSFNVKLTNWIRNENMKLDRAKLGVIDVHSGYTHVVFDDLESTK